MKTVNWFSTTILMVPFIMAGCGLKPEPLVENNQYEQINYQHINGSNPTQMNGNTFLEGQMMGGDLQAINESFNYNNIHEEPLYPKEDIQRITEDDVAIYNNGAQINRNGIMEVMPQNGELEPYQYHSFIRTIIKEISENVVYLDGSYARIKPDFFKVDQNDTYYMNKKTKELFRKDLTDKLNGVSACYHLIRNEIALQNYLGGMLTILTDAYNDQDYLKYVQANQRLTSLNYVLNEGEL